MTLRPPAGIRQAVAGEHVLAHAATPTGPLIATRSALHLPTGARVSWDLVVRASWEPPLMRLVLQDRPGSAHRDVAIALAEPGRVPAVVRERVTWSVVAEQHVTLVGDRGARLVARRTQDGSVRWTVVFDAGLDPADPALRTAVDEALGRVRASLGV